jgi:hypothetical protein
MKFMRRLLSAGSSALVAAILSLSFSAVVEAQWLPDRSYTVGPGFRIGDFELHPGVAVRGGYDSNVFRTDQNRVGSAIIAATPHINIQTLSKQRLTQGEEAAGAAGRPILPPIAFNLGAAATIFHYFDDRAPTNLEVDTDGALSILPDRPFGVDISAAYARQIRPFGAFAGFSANNLYAVDVIRPGVTFRAQSKSGVLKGSIGYKPVFQIFEHPVFEYLSSRQHEVVGNAAWKFFPYTALLYDANYAFTQYYNSDSSSARVLLSPKGNRFQTRLGLNGTVTNHFSVRALAGYAVVTFDELLLNDYETPVGEAAFNIHYGGYSFELGYQRTLTPASVGGWMEQDRGSVTLDALFQRVFALQLTGGIAGANYGRLLNQNGGALGRDKDTAALTDKRHDLRADAGLHAEYRVTNWLAIMADFAVLTTRTNFRFDVAGGAGFPAQFLSLQAFGGVRAHY